MYFDVVIIGGGLSGVKVATELSQAGLNCALVMKGRSLSDVSLMNFKGTFLPTDTVLSGTFDGDRLVSVSTRNLGPDALQAEYFILATGKYASSGLKADYERVYEPVLGLDVSYVPDQQRWFSPDFFAQQPFLKFGVKVDSRGHAFRKGKILDNVFAAGELLSGVNIVDTPEKIEKSALRVVKAILKR